MGSAGVAATPHLYVLILALLAAASSGSPTHNDETPPVKIAQGELVGKIRATQTGGTKFLSFKGIPYAKPPVGDLRFKAPQPPLPWTGVLAATSEGNMCPQKASNAPAPDTITEEMKQIMSMAHATEFMTRLMLNAKEDCLFLNVYTPVAALPAAKLVPVLVYFHGGAFQFGNGDEAMLGPDLLVDHGVMLVTVNYRLGPFGFLSTNTSDAPGNAGLKDQVAALRWVRDNIEAFGGDPKKVTIYGESAGSASVHFHVLSPMSKGLFHGAILSSSVVQTPYVFLQYPLQASVQLAERLGAGSDTVADPKRLVQFLRDKDEKDIVGKILSWPMPHKNWHHMFSRAPFGPVVEPKDSGEEAFLAQSPNEILRSGQYNKVPMIIGANNKEGSLVYFKSTAEESLARANASFTVVLPPNIYDVLTPKKREEVAMKVRKFYLGDKPISMDTLPDIMDALGDGMLLHSVRVGGRWHIKHATPEAPVYLYHFTKSAFSMLSYLIGAPDSFNGAGHCDDLMYVFTSLVVKDAPASKAKQFAKGRAQFSELIANFASSSKPVPSRSNNVDTDWPPASLPAEQYLDIGEELRMKQNLLKERLDFWDEIYRSTSDDPIYYDVTK